MGIVKYIEDRMVETAFAEVNAWSACPTINENRKEHRQMKKKKLQRKKYAKRATLFGILSFGLYAAVFMNSELVMKYFTRGGICAVLPVATVLAFSYAHGSFASNVWSALGIESSKKSAARKQAPAEKRPESRTRPRLHA